MIDDLKEGLRTMVSDLPRFGAIFLISAIVLGVTVVASFTPQVFSSTANPYANATTCAGHYYVYPIFNVLNLSLGEAQLQCSITNLDVVALILYYLEITGILMLGLYVGIIFHIGGI